jgi:hypothetical protein
MGHRTSPFDEHPDRSRTASWLGDALVSDAHGDRPMSELYGRYHGRILALARGSTGGSAWRPKLREILAEFDEDCRRLPALGRYVARNELSSQIERELLQFSDPDKQAILALALKHFDSAE